MDWEERAQRRHCQRGGTYVTISGPSLFRRHYNTVTFHLSLTSLQRDLRYPYAGSETQSCSIHGIHITPHHPDVVPMLPLLLRATRSYRYKFLFQVYPPCLSATRVHPQLKSPRTVLLEAKTRALAKSGDCICSTESLPQPAKTATLISDLIAFRLRSCETRLHQISLTMGYKCLLRSQSVSRRHTSCDSY